jgi:hypothetical protein
MSREMFHHELPQNEDTHEHQILPPLEVASEEEQTVCIEQEVHKETVPSYESVLNKNSVDLYDYIDCFRVEEISKDEAETERARQNILRKEAALSPEELAGSKERKKIATMLEEITVTLGNHPAWIPNARFIRASEYDDLCRGTDLIIAIKQPKTGRPIIIAVDVTTGRNEVSSKLHTIVRPGDMIFNQPSLKYHPGLKYMQEERAKGAEVKPVAVAKLVLGASADVVKETHMAMRNAANANERMTARNMNRLKYVILQGGLIQAQGLCNHAQAINQAHTAKVYGHIADVFQKALDVHDHIFGAFPEEYAERSDPVLDEIKTIESSRYNPVKIAK